MINWPATSIENKVLVIQSDDWGTVRTTDNFALKLLRKHNIRVDECHYTMYDSVADQDDLELLFETLGSHKSWNGSRPVLTANCLSANPDFEKIRQSGFREYHYETMFKTLERYSNGYSLNSIWQKGIEEGIFYPQSHGREHVNVSRWMRSLQTGDETTHLAFDMGIFGLSNKILPKPRPSHLAAFDIDRDGELYDRKDILKSGLDLFKRQFGFQSRSFIPPNYVWDDSVEETLADSGVIAIQGSHVQQLTQKEGRNKRIRHYSGQRSSLGQTYLVRNVHFEPSEKPDFDWVNYALSQINLAFLLKKPAILSTHRVNYIGRLKKANRDRGLRQLDELLGSIIRKWPDVVFLDTPGLYNLITKNP